MEKIKKKNANPKSENLNDENAEEEKEIKSNVRVISRICSIHQQKSPITRGIALLLTFLELISSVLLANTNPNDRCGKPRSRNCHDQHCRVASSS